MNNSNVGKKGRIKYRYHKKTILILSALASYQSIKKIAENFDLGLSMLYKHRLGFEKLGLINKFGELSYEGRKVIDYYADYMSIYRLHNIKVVINVPKMYISKLNKNKYNVL